MQERMGAVRLKDCPSSHQAEDIACHPSASASCDLIPHWPHSGTHRCGLVYLHRQRMGRTFMTIASSPLKITRDPNRRRTASSRTGLRNDVHPRSTTRLELHVETNGMWQSTDSHSSLLWWAEEQAQRQWPAQARSCLLCYLLCYCVKYSRASSCSSKWSSTA